MVAMDIRDSQFDIVNHINAWAFTVGIAKMYNSDAGSDVEL